MRASSACTLLFFAALLPAQGRVLIGGVATNLVLNLSSTSVVPDPMAGNAFFALMPFSSGQYSFDFATFEDTITMNMYYGSGNWLRCRMVATHWAYLSNNACAHQPATGTTAPQSILMSDFDSGGYPGMPGTPNQPWPGATMFSGSTWSTVQGLGLPSTPERWSLRTRGFFPTDPWNACPGIGSVAPNFSGWLIARFTFSFV